MFSLLRWFRACGMLRSEDRKRREQAVRLLGRCKPKRAVPVLVRFLEDGHPLVRVACAEELARFSAVEALPALVAAAERGIGNPYLSATIWESVERIAGEEVDFDPNESDGDQQERVRRWRERLAARR